MTNLKSFGWGWYLGWTWVIENSKCCRGDASGDLLTPILKNMCIGKMWNKQQRFLCMFYSWKLETFLVTWQYLHIELTVFGSRVNIKKIRCQSHTTKKSSQIKNLRNQRKLKIVNPYWPLWHSCGNLRTWTSGEDVLNYILKVIGPCAYSHST